MNRWRVDSDECIPVEVECPEHGYPNMDVDGHKQFVNTHFDTESEAWTHGRAEVKAAVSMARALVRESSKSLEKSKERLVAQSLLWGDFEEAAINAGHAVKS